MRKIATLCALVISLNLGCNSTPPKPKQLQPKIQYEAGEKFQKIDLFYLQSLVLTEARDNQTVHFGEDHIRKADDEFVISLLPELKKQGFKYLAVEFDSHEQSLVDSYLRGDITKKEFHRTLKRISSYVFKNTHGVNKYNLKCFMPLIEAGYKEGFEIVIFDERPEGYTAPGDTTFSHFGTERNQMEFDNLKRFIFDKEPDAKVIVYSGRMHISEKPGRHSSTNEPGQIELGFFLEEYTDGKNLSVSLIEEEIQRSLSEDFYTRPDLSLSIKY